MEDILESSYLNEKIKIGEYTNEIKIIDMLIILCVLFSLTAVSASDNQTEVISDSPDYHSFSELNQLLSESDGEITLEYDYKYDGNEIHIKKDKEFTINGNNHIIDGIEETDIIFESKNSTITINNLTIQNAVNGTLSFMSPAIFNNVKFINCTSQDHLSFIVSYLYNKFDGCLFQDNGGYEFFISSMEDIDLLNFPVV